MSFVIYDLDSSDFIYETFCLESLTKRFKMYNHSIFVVWNDSIPEIIKSVFSDFFNFKYENGPLGYKNSATKFIFDPNTSDYVPAMALRLMRDRNKYDLSESIVKMGMENVINKLSRDVYFGRSYLFYSSDDSLKEYLLPEELLFATYLREIKKFDEILKKNTQHNGIINALYNLLRHSAEFKSSVKNTLLENFTGRKITLSTYNKDAFYSYNTSPYGQIEVDVDFLIPFIYRSTTEE